MSSRDHLVIVNNTTTGWFPVRAQQSSRGMSRVYWGAVARLCARLGERLVA
jgi:hypothetical protein